MREYTIGDVSYNQDGELEQFLIFWELGEPDTRRATAENVLLFDPEDELPFDGGLHQFFEGDSALKLSEDPRIVLAQAGDEYSYVVSVGGNTVETTPGQAEPLLDAVYTALVDGDTTELRSLHRDIMSSQVRREVINPLCSTFPESDRIEILANGWLVDGFFLVDWDAKLYTSDDDPSEGDYVRSGGDVVKKDTSYEFVRLRRSMGELESESVALDGMEYELTEREMLFLAKVTWLLDREHYHPDNPFWEYTNQWADMPAEEPNLDVFDI